jgi:hypothetical protein
LHENIQQSTIDNISRLRDPSLPIFSKCNDGLEKALGLIFLFSLTFAPFSNLFFEGSSTMLEGTLDWCLIELL